MKTFLTLASLMICTLLSSQERIDGSMPFQTDQNKKYSIYIPSTYDASTPNELMVGLHPLNTSRWDAESWCDTLIQFSEMNGLLMICPDGGIDGKIDDAIDTAFTSVIIDSMFQWYNVNPSRVWAMGFSWGGKTTYSYGLNHVNRFAGFMPIGAAINGTSEISTILTNAAYKPYFLVHGSLDTPNSRYYPLLEALENNNACVSSNLLQGVGHTIDFPNRNMILTEALTWLRNQVCVSNVIEVTPIEFKVTPNPSNGVVTIETMQSKGQVVITNISGQIVLSKEIDQKMVTVELNPGVYFVSQIINDQKSTKKIVVK